MTEDAANLAAALVAQAGTRPDLQVGTVDDQLDLSDALAFAAGRARELLSWGLLPGQRVALVAPTSTDYLITWMACLLAGLPVALVNPTYPDELVDRMLEPLDPTLVLRPDQIALSRTNRGSLTELPGLAVDRFAIASFMHTSGTTGLPKFCAQSHDYFARMAEAMSAALELTPADRVLAPLPLFHINPMGYGIITALLTGADALTVTKFSASGFWPAVIGEQITVLILHAPPVEILKRATTADHATGHRVRTMFYADREFLHRFGVPAAVSGYGSTEAGGVSHLHRWNPRTHAIPDDASRHGGAPRADIQWRLDARGIIFVREREHAALFDGYVRTEGLDPARDADGWFHTGDLGRTEGPDHLVFVERAAESIRVKGEFVPIAFVENHLAAVEGLTDHALWKRKGALVDDEVVLYAVADPLPLERLRESIAELPAFMRPSAIARVDGLPRDAAVGKVQRRLLVERPVLEWVELA
ncbi:MAG: class I adenylate-forming enzyme family protein [Marmoricola sp.]